MLVAVYMPQVGFCMSQVGYLVQGGRTMHATGRILHSYQFVPQVEAREFV